MNRSKDSNQNIAKTILKIRQDNKLSQEQFAEIVGVTRHCITTKDIPCAKSPPCLDRARPPFPHT